MKFCCEDTTCVGDKRIHRWFLFFPKRIGKITRWLEMATWEEEYQYICEAGDWNPRMYDEWRPTKWLDIDDKGNHL